MPIVRVLDSRNQVLHDCAAAGCQVSWDGVALVDGLNLTPPPPPGGVPPAPLLVQAGQRVPGWAGLPPGYEQLDAQTARQLPPPTF